MAELPTPPHDLVTKIYQWREQREGDGFRPHLGASLIGRPCSRELWYTFRWCTRRKFSGRMLRLFDRGQREEAVFLEELAGIGAEVLNGEAGAQFRVSFHGGHFGGSLDGAAKGIPEAPTKWHVTEFKTHNAKSFAKLEKAGVAAAKPEHFAQMQVYMHGTDMDRALYLAANKDTDALYAERVPLDKKVALQLLVKAEQIIFSVGPPPKLSEDPAWWQCKNCNHAGLCHGDAIPAATCRSCCHASPEREGDGRWSCAAWPADEIPLASQKAGCERHVYLPDLLRNWALLVDATASGTIYREIDAEATFENGPGGIPSRDLQYLHTALAPAVAAALEEFPGAEVVTP